MVDVALLDDGPVRVLAAPPAERAAVLPQDRQAEPVRGVERRGEVVLHVARGQVEPREERDGWMSSNSMASKPFAAHMAMRASSIGVSAPSCRKSTHRSCG